MPTPWRDRTERDLFVVLMLVASLMAFRVLVDVDLPGHLAYGLVHLQTGALQAAEPYSYTAPGHPWINHEWAFELLIAVVYSACGQAGLLALQGFAWLGVGFAVAWLVRRQTSDFPPAAVLFVLFAAQAYPSVSIRPQLVTFLSFAVTLLLLERARAGKVRGLWLVPPLMAAWTNFHGGFLAGLGVLGLYVVGALGDTLLRRPVHGEQGDQPLPARTAALFSVAGLLAVAGTFVNPYGPGLHAWLKWSLEIPNPHVSEWRSVELDLQGVTYLASVALVGAALIARGPRRVPLAHALPLLVTAALGLKHVRHVPFFMIEACAFAAGAVALLYRRLVPRDPEADLTAAEHRRMRAVAAALLVAAVGVRFGLGDVRLRLKADSSAAWPTGAILHVDELLRRRQAEGAPPLDMLVFFDWAQLAIWRWHPLVRVHYDGRHRTCYPMEIEHEHFDYFLEPQPEGDWRRALTSWPTEAVLVPTGALSDRRMRDEPGWRLVYTDRVGSLYLRADVAPVGSPVVGPDASPELAFETRLGEPEAR